MYKIGCSTATKNIDYLGNVAVLSLSSLDRVTGLVFGHETCNILKNIDCSGFMEVSFMNFVCLPWKATFYKILKSKFISTSNGFDEPSLFQKKIALLPLIIVVSCAWSNNHSSHIKSPVSTDVSCNVIPWSQDRDIIGPHLTHQGFNESCVKQFRCQFASLALNKKRACSAWSWLWVVNFRCMLLGMWNVGVILHFFRCRW